MLRRVDELVNWQTCWITVASEVWLQEINAVSARLPQHVPTEHIHTLLQEEVDHEDME